jgi:hypothetical protein
MKYVTALDKRFYVMGSGQPKQIGSAKMENPLVLYTTNQLSELSYMKRIQSAFTIRPVTLDIFKALLRLGDALGIARPEHLQKTRFI